MIYCALFLLAYLKCTWIYFSVLWFTKYFCCYLSYFRPINYLGVAFLFFSYKLIKCMPILFIVILFILCKYLKLYFPSDFSWGLSYRAKSVWKSKTILYINTYMWSLGKWYRWTYLQSRNRGADAENRPVVMGWGGALNWEIGVDMYTPLCVGQMAGGRLLGSMRGLAQCSGVTWMGGLEGEEGESKREGICMYVAVSLHCAVEFAVLKENQPINK